MRPTKYKPEYCEMLIEHMGNGFSYETFGVDLKISRTSLYRWEEAHPEFRDAKVEAFAACQRWFEKVGMQQMVKGKGNSSTWIFSMKNRFKWTDRQEVSSPEGQAPISISITERKPD